jgi:hypothetical protein
LGFVVVHLLRNSYVILKLIVLDFFCLIHVAESRDFDDEYMPKSTNAPIDKWAGEDEADDIKVKSTF